MTTTCCDASSCFQQLLLKRTRKGFFVSFITPQYFCCENWWFILNKTYEISRSLINNNHILRSFRNLFSLLCFKSCFSKFQIRTFYCLFCLFVLRLSDDKSTRTTIMTWLWRMQQLNFLFNIFFSKKASALGFVQGPRHHIFPLMQSSGFWLHL